MLKREKEKTNRIRYILLIFQIFTVFVISIILTDRSKCILDSDALWHIKQGERIIKEGVLRTDNFSIHKNLYMTAHEWLYDVLSYLVLKYSGYKGLFIAVIFASVLGFTLCIIYGSKKIKDIIGKTILLSALVLTGFSKKLFAIPDTFAVLFLILQMYFLRSDKLKFKTKLVINFFIVLILANIHGGMMAAYILQLTVLIFVDVIKFYDDCFKKDFKQHLIILIETVLTGFINPYGLKIYMYGFYVIGSNASKITADWLPFSFNNLLEVIIVVGIIILSIIGNDKLFEFNKADLQSYGICTLWFIFMLTHNRFVNIFLYMFIMLSSGWVLNFIYQKVQIPKILEKITIFLSFIVFGGIFIISVFLIEKPKVNSISDITKDYITDEMKDYIKNNNSVVFNSQDIAGYLIYEDIPVFIDGRTDLYVKGFNKTNIASEYEAACYSSEIMDDLVDKYKINTLILNNNSISYEIYNNSTKWKITTKGPKTTLFSLKNSIV